MALVVNSIGYSTRVRSARGPKGCALAQDGQAMAFADAVMVLATFKRATLGRGNACFFDDNFTWHRIIGTLHSSRKMPPKLRRPQQRP